MRKKIIFIVSLIFLTILALNLLFRAGLYSNVLKKILTSKLEQELNASVIVDNVRLNIFPPFLYADHLTIREKKDSSLPLFKADHLTVSFSPASLFARQTLVHKIQIQNPEIYLVWDEMGKANFDFLPILVSSAVPPPIHIQKIVLVNAKLDINHKLKKIHSLIPSLEITVEANRTMTDFQINGSTKEIFYELDKNMNSLLLRTEWKLRWGPDHFDIKKLNIASNEGSAALKGDLNLVPKNGEYPFRIDADFHLNPLKKWKMMNGLSGRSNVTGILDRDRNLSGNVELSSISLERGKTAERIGEFRGNFFYDYLSLRLDQVKSNLFGASIEGAMVFKKEEKTIMFESKYSLLHLALNRIIPLINPSERKFLEGRTLDSSGTLKIYNLESNQIESSGHFHLTKSENAKTDPKKPFVENLMISLYSAESDYQYSGSTLSFQNAAVREGSALVQGNGTLDKDGTLHSLFSIQTDKGGEILSWLGFPQWTGRGEFSGEIAGTLSSPTLRGKGSVRDVTFEDHSLGEGTGELIYADRKLSFSNARISKGTGRYSGDGYVLWESLEKFTYQISAQAFHGIPDDIISIFISNIPLYTQGSGVVTLAGNDKTLHVQGNIDLENGTLYDEVFDSGHVNFEISENEIIFRDATLARGSSTLFGNGEISFQGSYHEEIHASNLDLEYLRIVSQRLPGLSGSFNGLIEGKGTFKEPFIKLSGTLPAISYHNQELKDGTVNVSLQGNQLLTDLKFKDHPVRLNGSIDLNKPFISSFEIQGDRIPIIPLLATTTGVQLTFLTGTISGKLNIEGPLSEPQRLNCSANISQLDADFGGYPVSNKGDLNFQVKEGALSIDSFHLKGDGTALSITGGLQLFKQLNLFITGEADFSLLKNFSKIFTYGKGKAYLALNIYDAWSDPKFQGGLNVQEGQIKTSFYSQPINISSIGLFFNERQVFLESLDASLGEGIVHITGKIDINQFKMGHFALIMETKDSRFTFFPGWASTISGTVIYQGDVSTQTLQGEISLSHGLYNKKFDPKPFIKKLTEMRENRRTPIPILGKTRLNIHLLGLDDLRINNNVARFPFTADLTLKGTVDHPILIGRMETDNGSITFYNRTFTVSSISVDFIDPEEIKPLIDLKAGTQIYSSAYGRSYQIDLGLSGSLDELNRTLTADDPTLTETDILSLILAGKKATDVATDPASQQGIAGSLVPLVIETPFEGLFEDFTGVNSISVDPNSPPLNLTNPNATGGPRVTMEEHLLNDKLLLNYAYIMNPSQDQQVTLDYLLDRHFYIQAIRNVDGTVGGNLKLRFEFK